MIEPRGGTELLYTNLVRNIGEGWRSRVNLLVSGFHPNQIDPSKINVLWQHLDIDQVTVQLMQDKSLVDRLDHVVFVSHWQHDQYQHWCDLSGVQCHVIHNAIDPIKYRPKPRDAIRLIYTSMPNRGLDMLLDAYALVYKPSIELNIFSSNIIYGGSYALQTRKAYEALFYRCRTQPGVVYRGYALNQAVRQQLQRSHIFSYPSTYRETSCMAAIEAGAAGCKLITTDLGALPETCGGYAEHTLFTYDRQMVVEEFAHALQNAIDNIHDHDGAAQSEWFNQNYSWTTRAQQWKQFLGSL